jgi:hypothetical protein
MRSAFQEIFSASVVTTLVLCVAASACSRGQPGGAARPFGDSAAAATLDSLVLEVENHNWSDVVVFITHDGVTSRLAQVAANGRATHPIAPHLVGALGMVRFTVRRIGGTDSYASGQLSLRTGSIVKLTVESRLASSSVAVW